MPQPKTYQNFAEFEREYLRPGRVGYTLEDLAEESAFDAELDFEKDLFDGSDSDDDF
ncbi:MAG TPA: hypothetical protein VLS89_03845 [Candidatus Nanopelagicales bacterium]|nr:hypothetical protein [Candidatus Nanopelagicales bacterium]